MDVTKTPPGIPAPYLEWLKSRGTRVDLFGFRLKHRPPITLADVYVPLTTTYDQRLEHGQALSSSSPPEVERPALLLDRLNQSSSLLVTGDAGSGKSTFSRWVTLVTALGEVPQRDLDAPADVVERLPDGLRNRLPVLIPLRELGGRLPDSGQPPAVAARTLEAALVHWLGEKADAGLGAPVVRAHLDAGSTLIVLDGLDDVPAPQRVTLIGALSEALPAWTGRGHRVVVTSRLQGLTPQDLNRLKLPIAPILPLAGSRQGGLVRRAFRALIDDVPKADAIAADLMGELGTQVRLAPLAAHPLLLTALCIVFRDGHRLPDDTFDLYDRLVDALLYNSLSDRSRVPRVRGRLAAVAHGMHTGEGLGETRATPATEVTDDEVDRLLRVYQEKRAWVEQNPQRVQGQRDELLAEAGVLLKRDDRRAEFTHVTIQEFLAAERIADVDAERLGELVSRRSQTPEWRTTLSFLFGSFLARDTSPERAASLLSGVVGRGERHVGLQIVAADGMDTLRGRGIGLESKHETRLRATWLETMRGDPFARNRHEAGKALGLIGDTRFRADTWYLPDEPLLGFVKIAAGPFIMGSDPQRDKEVSAHERPAHPVTVPAYWISRWPVTVSQFRACVADSGMNLRDPQGLGGIDNQPVVSVTWHEARQYCAWLTRKLRAWPAAPAAIATAVQSSDVTLPSEAEWEKAARGNDGRVYPWGEKADPNRANYDETGIGAITAVGCFLEGASPHKVEDLSGNVWEWTRSLWGADATAPTYGYPYRPDDGRENLAAPDDVRRVVRGGACFGTLRSIGAARRNRFAPGLPSTQIGFRLVIPFR